MKKFICLLLACTLLTGLLSGCDRQAVSTPAAETEQTQAANFAPETTAVTTQQYQIIDEADAGDAASEDSAQDAPAEDATAAPADVPADVPVDEPAGGNEAEPSFTVNPTDVPEDIVPFSTPTPQPNTNITSYSTISGTGLGFKFDYPSDWVNIPGRSTVCYVQPLKEGTVYPARVAVTMKKLAHAADAIDAQNELVEYLKLLMTQYDATTFKVSKEMDTSTKFMGKNGMSATYLAYDGEQEIKGYVILTYFERYVYCFHFLCAYEDYEAFDTAMRRIRDSVQVEQTEAE